MSNSHQPAVTALRPASAAPSLEKSISDWVDDVFPPLPDAAAENAKRIRRLLEEVVELLVADWFVLGPYGGAINLSDAINVVMTCWRKAADPAAHHSVGDEIADINITLIALAHRRGYSVEGCTALKMADNLKRPREYYAAKTADKAALGL